MAATLRLLDDSFNVITSENFGAIDAGSNSVVKIYVENYGSTSATSVTLSRARIAQNDGVDYVTFAQDNGSGNPGTYSSADVNLGTVTAGQRIPIWVKATIPLGLTPQGNPRQFNVTLSYRGT